MVAGTHRQSVGGMKRRQRSRLTQHTNCLANGSCPFPRLERALIPGPAEKRTLEIREVALETGGVSLRIGAREVQLVDDAMLEHSEVRARKRGRRATTRVPLLHHRRGG